MTADNSTIRGFRSLFRRKPIRPSVGSIIHQGIATYSGFPRESARTMFTMYLIGWGYSKEQSAEGTDLFFPKAP